MCLPCYMSIKVTLVAKRNICSIYHAFFNYVLKDGGDGCTSNKLHKV